MTRREIIPPAPTAAEMISVLKRINIGVVWTSQEIARRRVVIEALIERLKTEAANGR